MKDYKLAEKVKLAGYVKKGEVEVREGKIDELEGIEMEGELDKTVLLCLAEGFGRL